MSKHQLTSITEEIATILAENPEKEFYINELIRITGKYPNSITNSLKKLTKLGYIHSRKQGNKIFFSINDIGIKNFRENKEHSDIPNDWIKLLNRKVACAFNAAVCLANISTLKDTYGITIPSFWGNGITHGVYYSENELVKLAKEISSLIEKDPKFALNDIKTCKKRCSQLVNYSKEIDLKSLKLRSNDELLEILEKFYRYYLELLVFIVVPHSIERYFESKIREAIQSKKDLDILLSPSSLELEELGNILEIISHVKKYGYDKKYNKLIKEQKQHYCWLNMWDITEKSLPLEYFDKSVREANQSVRDPIQELENLRKQEIHNKILLKNTLNKLKASRTLHDYVNFLQEYITLRTIRKNSISEAHYYIKPLIIEVARRLCINENDIFLLTFPEIINTLKNPSDFSAIKTELSRRNGGLGVLMLNENITLVSGIKEIVETIEKYHIVPKPSESKNNIILGKPATNGYTKGTAKVIYEINQLDKVKKGDILIAKMTTPDFVMAMRKCSGIITDEGGITCHAAIVSREMNIPCIVGTKNATSNIQDGYIIELEATKGYAKIVQKNISNFNSSHLYGKPIFGKIVSGNVKIINDDSDLSRTQVGDIIVAPQITPIALSVLFKVKGLIIEENSLTSHAVLYSKAMNIPCIIGVVNARSNLVDGEEITIDFKTGIIEKIQGNS